MVDPNGNGGIELLERLARERQTGDHSGLTRHQPTPRAAIRPHRCRSGNVVLGVVFLERLSYQCRELFLRKWEMESFFPEESVTGELPLTLPLPLPLPMLRH